MAHCAQSSAILGALCQQIATHPPWQARLLEGGEEDKENTAGRGACAGREASGGGRSDGDGAR